MALSPQKQAETKEIVDGPDTTTPCATTGSRVRVVNSPFSLMLNRQGRTQGRHIIMSIKPEHMANIARGDKNHEYRKYRMPPAIKHIWFYITQPESSIRYVAQIGPAREPGQVPEDGGIGNADFNAGKKVSKFGYQIRKLYELPEPLTLHFARQHGFLKSPPQKYVNASDKLLKRFPLHSLEVVLDRSTNSKRKRDDGDVQADETPKEKKNRSCTANEELLVLHRTCVAEPDSKEGGRRADCDVNESVKEDQVQKYTTDKKRDTVEINVESEKSR